MQPALFELEGGPLKAKNGVEHRQMACKSILNYCDTPRMPDCFTINPYRGCEFGCGYCYARYTHAFMDLGWKEFEERIYVKRDAGRALLRELDVGRLRGRHVAIGTATDPYQPAEARFRVTRSLLEAFDQVEGLNLSITTKSSLVQRDIPLLQRLNRRNRLQVNISLISLDESLLRGLEPKASRPAARLAALCALREAGISAGIFMIPILPWVTDSEENLEAVIAEARRRDAQFLACDVLFLSAASRPAYFAYLRRCQPHLLDRCRGLFERDKRSLESYRGRILGRVEGLKERYGFAPAKARMRRQAPAAATLF